MITILTFALIIYLFGLYYTSEFHTDLDEHRLNKLKQFINDEKYYEAAKYYIKKDFFCTKVI